MARYVNIDRDTPLLLPPDLRDWVPADHLVHFVIDAVELIDTRTAPVNERGTGSEQYPPGMLLALLVYSYATGMFSSRQIERASYENVAVRLLCADTHPDHDTLCTFRRKNGPLLTQAFKQILELSARCGVLQVGQITVAIDGTKILANASKHSAVSHGHAEKTLRALDLEIAELLAKADQADATPLQDGLTIPAEAKAEMEARAYARFQAEQAAKPNSPAAPRPPPVGNHPAAAPRKPPIRRRNPRTKSTSPTRRAGS
jgi:transposase